MPKSAPLFRPPGARSPTAARQDQDRTRRVALPWRRFYSTLAWRMIRARQLADEPWCEWHRLRGKLVPATVVDHEIAHLGEWSRFVQGPFLSLCASHHNSEAQRADRVARGLPATASAFADWRLWPRGLLPPAGPLHMVCGPPAAGKTTYVAAHAAPSDLVIDLDAIVRTVTHGPAVRASAAELAVAIDRRNRQLRSLAAVDYGTRKWFIVGAPSAYERAWWAKRLRPTGIIIVDTPLDLCLDRIAAEPKRAPKALEQAQAARRWWRLFAAEPRPGGPGEPATVLLSQP